MNDLTDHLSRYLVDQGICHWPEDADGTLPVVYPELPGQQVPDPQQLRRDGIDTYTVVHIWQVDTAPESTDYDGRWMDRPVIQFDVRSCKPVVDDQGEAVGFTPVELRETLERIARAIDGQTHIPAGDMTVTFAKRWRGPMPRPTQSDDDLRGYFYLVSYALTVRREQYGV